MTIKNSILAETEGGRENEPERMSGRAGGRVGGITTGKSVCVGGGLTNPGRVILAKVFESAAIFSLALLPACFPNLGYQDLTYIPNPTPPPLRVNEGEEEEEGGSRGGRSLVYYGKSPCSSCRLPTGRCFSGAGAEAAGIYPCWHNLKKKEERDREGTGRARDGRRDLLFVLSATWQTARCSVLCLLPAGELDRPPSLLSPSPRVMCGVSTRHRKELLYPLPPVLALVSVLGFFFFF